MIFCASGLKGGAGKSTVATNLACIAAASFNVLLVDADDQQTSADFTAVRKQDHPEAPRYTCVRLSGMAVRTELLSMKKDYDHIIIDAGGRDTTSQRAALTITDLALVPFAPRSFDIWTVNTVAGIMEEIRTVNPGLRACAFLNRADMQGSENREAAEMLAEIRALEFIDTPLGNRKAFAHAATLGLSVTELPKKTFNERAANEIMTLFQYCFQIKATLQEAV